jgi:hypothetical protein
MQLVPPGMPYTLVTLCKTAAAFAAGSPVFTRQKAKRAQPFVQAMRAGWIFLYSILLYSILLYSILIIHPAVHRGKMLSGKHR